MSSAASVYISRYCSKIFKKHQVKSFFSTVFPTMTGQEAIVSPFSRRTASPSCSPSITGASRILGSVTFHLTSSCPESKTDGQIQSSKWDVLISGLTELAENGHKCLVFTNFISCIESISQQLEENGIEHLVMTGATNNRSEIVKKFKTDSRYKVFLMTLKTGGVGLNLTEADYVYIIDPWWNTSAEQQEIDRTHRIGQTKNVFCYRMIAKNTIEEKILELQNRKKDLFAQVISSDTQLMKKLTVEDIDYLLKK